MGCYYSVSASANQNTVTVTGSFTNNGYTYSGMTETFWTECNGTRQYMYRTIPQGASFSWTHSYNVGNSTSTRSYTVSAGGPSWSNFDNSSASTTVSVPATPPSVTTPPVVTNQKAVLSGSTVTISWTNNGSGTSNPTGNHVDVRVDDSDWENILNTKATSTTYSVSANHKYEFRVNSYNSAGSSAHQSTNTIYTAPATPTVVNPVGVIFPSAGSFNFSVDNSSTLYPSDKVEWQYSTDGGSSWSSTQTANGTSISISSSDSTLNSFIMGMKNNDNCYVRIRIYNYDNSIASDWSTAVKINVVLQPICYVNIPDGANIKAVYINMPADYIPPHLKEIVNLVQSNIKINGQVPTKSQIDLNNSTKDCVFLNLLSDQEYTIETNYDVSEAVISQGEANTLTSRSPEETPITRSELIALNSQYDYVIWITSAIVLPVDGEAVNITGSFTDDNIVTKTNVSGAVILNNRNCIYAGHQSRSSASMGDTVNFGSFKINVQTQNAPNTQYRLHLPKNWLMT